MKTQTSILAEKIRITPPSARPKLIKELAENVWNFAVSIDKTIGATINFDLDAVEVIMKGLGVSPALVHSNSMEVLRAALELEG